MSENSARRRRAKAVATAECIAAYSPATRGSGCLAIAEDVANIVTHAVSIPAVVFAFLELQLRTNTAREFFVLALYGGMMLSLFAVSAVYHFICLLVRIYPTGEGYKYMRVLLRMADRSMIHLFIASCYTPWLLLRDNGPFAEDICKAVWIFAIFSILAQNLPFKMTADNEILAITMYLILGVLPGTFIGAFTTDTGGLLPLAAGGALYIVGLIFYFAEGYLPFSHAIWHLFVNSGAFVHYRAMTQYLIRESKENRGVLVVSGFVFLNMVVTLSIWCYVYEMKHMVYSHFPMLDVDGLSTTGNNLLDGILNGLFIATIIAVMSVIMGQCILHRLKSCVVLFVKSTFMMMSYIMPATIIFDTLLKFLGPENPYIYLFTIIASLLFTSTIVAAYFTDHLPTFIRQILTILNCSCVSIYYLRFLPRYTIWFLMAAIILWDLFSVNSSFGPLKVAALNAHDYSERILPFMFFIAKNNKNKEEEEEEESSDENSENNSTSDTFSDNNTTINDEEEDEESCSDECLTEFTLNSTFSYDEIEDSIEEENNVKNEERTAFDALNVSGQTVIGMGDFVIYGLLVGKAAADMDGCFNFAVLFTIIGVLFGLFYTLTLSEESDNDDEPGYLPALPIPLTIGTVMYFLTSFVIGKFDGENNNEEF
uniref:Uncharacterized protein n=1 Tax=Meloidogyne floridensis TaxID=298350 RepID=A0A915NN47_9BILA